MSGEVSGTKKFIALENTPGSGTYTQIGGEISSVLTMNTTPVEITNKSAGDFATYLADEGLQNATLSGEFRLNDDATFASLVAAFNAKSMLNWIFGDATVGEEFAAQVIGITKTANQAEAVTASISWQISGDFEALAT